MSEIDWHELETAQTEANVGLQAIQRIAGLAELEEARVRFPRGYLRTSVEARRLFKFVRKPVLQTNLGYAVQLADVYTWLLTRTDIAGIARDMVVKAYLALAGGIAEALLVDRYHGQKGWRQTFVTRLQHVQDEGHIDQRLHDELVWLWDMRNRQHVFEIDSSEFFAYQPTDFSRARTAVNGLIAGLTAATGQALKTRTI